MKRFASGLALGLVVVAVASAQPFQIQTPPNEGVLPALNAPQANNTNLERQLRMLRQAVAGMGESHPQIHATRQKIQKLEAELEAFRAVPNPFAEMEEDGLGPVQIVERLSDEELRVLLVRLAIDVKDLSARVQSLERKLEIRVRR
ncbi:MAG: hypothetical protein AAGG44_10590 [Planctomycetota bacterium]